MTLQDKSKNLKYISFQYYVQHKSAVKMNNSENVA